MQFNDLLMSSPAQSSLLTQGLDRLVAGQRSEAEDLLKLHLQGSPTDAVAKHYLGVLLSYKPGKKCQGLKLILSQRDLPGRIRFFTI